MSVDSNVAPVIIKRKKVVGGDGHHGGAWKVAYADFVTAMMAFFMLMWLMNATTEQQRVGIADYFSPTIPIARVSGGGDGSFGGENIFSERVLPQDGLGATNLRTTDNAQAKGNTGLMDEGEAEAAAEEAWKRIEEALMGRGGESHVADDTFKHVITRVTDEGLLIEFFELPEARLFDDQDRPNELLKSLLGLVVEASTLVTNEIAVEGHVPASPIVIANNTVWDRSAERAQVVRQFLSDRGIDAERIQRVTGHADRENAVKNPMAIRNSRVEVIFLR
ncbi:flagellar motor protein MotB [Primorskyibacter sp. S187A]|uniref:OmpA/MotB family protein n=1 Tax=Primorskyibacter sp. S187A TaxID=3415130 RepID=UPI003C7DDDBC